MQVPALYCGMADDVRRVVRKQVRAYVRGAPWLEAIDGPMVDSAEVPGLIYLGPPGMGGAPKRPQVYLYMPYLEAFRAVDKHVLPRSVLDDLRVVALQSDWGSAVVLGGLALNFYVRAPACWPGLIRTALQRWPVLDAEGERYASITEEGKRLWGKARGLHYAIGQLGVRDYPMGRGIVFEPRAFLAEHGLLDRVLAATDPP